LKTVGNSVLLLFGTMQVADGGLSVNWRYYQQWVINRSQTNRWRLTWCVCPEWRI